MYIGRFGALPLAFLAIVIWASLATLVKFLSGLPTFFILGITLSIGGLPALFRWRAWRVGAATWALGLVGIFGYHFILFTSYRMISPLEAMLVNNLWPLLIVIFSAVLLAGYRLRPVHGFGACLALAGIALLGFSRGQAVFTGLEGITGYLLALTAAVIWALYSVLTKKVPPFSSFTVGAFCLVSGALCFLVHALTEAAAAPTNTEWFWLVFMGVGPMGISFYAWDAALKMGDSQHIGALSYLTPLLSALSLVIFTGESFTFAHAGALALILSGAAVSSRR